jgi:MFS family permease
MMLLSGVAAPLAARYAKYILVVGLTLFAVGMAYIAWTAQVTSNRWLFVPGLVIAGAGMAGIWTPVYSLATRDLQPRFAGVASGVISTVQELGAVLGSAAIGALLQNQLANDLYSRAVTFATQLPAQAQGPFVDGFSKAAKAGLEVGRGQSGTTLALPSGIPAQVAQQIQQVAHAVFTQAFVDAMRPTMALAVVVILAAAVGALWARNNPPRAQSAAGAARLPTWRGQPHHRRRRIDVGVLSRRVLRPQAARDASRRRDFHRLSTLQSLHLGPHVRGGHAQSVRRLVHRDP